MKLITTSNKIGPCCDNCRQRPDNLIEIDTAILGMPVVWLCKSCLKKALAIFPQEDVGQKGG